MNASKQNFVINYAEMFGNEFAPPAALSKASEQIRLSIRDILQSQTNSFAFPTSILPFIKKGLLTFNLGIDFKYVSNPH
jgi:hypothetical protein